jgi:hypothetical protein
MVVDTRNWLPGGKKVLISPTWIQSVSWEDSRVYVALSHTEIKTSPEWHGSSAALSRDYETELHSHYGRPTYWNYSNSRSALTFLYDLCRKALSQRISCTSRRV